MKQSRRSPFWDHLFLYEHMSNALIYIIVVGVPLMFECQRNTSVLQRLVLDSIQLFLFRGQIPCLQWFNCLLYLNGIVSEQGRFIHYLFDPTTEVVGYRLVTPFLFIPLGGILYQFKLLTLGHMVFSFGLNNTVNKGTRMALTCPGSTLAS